MSRRILSLPLQYAGLLILQIMLALALINYVSEVVENDHQALSNTARIFTQTSAAIEALRADYVKVGWELDQATQGMVPGMRLDLQPLSQQLRQIRSSLMGNPELENLRNRQPEAVYELNERLNRLGYLLIEQTGRLGSTDARLTQQIRDQLLAEYRQIMVDGFGRLVASANDEILQLAEITHQAGQTNLHLLKAILFGFVVLQVLLIMFALWLFNHQIGSLAKIAERLSKGDRRVNLPQQSRNDHIGKLARAIHHFRSSLDSLSASREQLKATLRKHDEVARERAKAELALQMAESAFKNIDEAIVISDTNGKVLRANHSMAKLVDRTDEQVLSTDPLDLILTGQHNLKSQIRQHLIQSGRWRGEIEFTTAGGREVIALLSAHYVRTPSKKGEHIIYIINDLTETRKTERKLIQLAKHDRVSGLLNRDAFYHRGYSYINRHPDQALGLLILGLDGFKSLNEVLGHQQGDQILRHVANRIKAIAPNNAILARLGGDEFAIAVAGKHAEAIKLELEALAQNLLEQLLQTAWIDNYSIKLHCSGGVAAYPIDGDNMAELLKAANTALHHAKSQGGDRIVVYASHLKDLAKRRFDIQQSLENALQNHEIKLWYQPQVSLSNGQLIGFEALMRWQRANGEWVSPADFIPLAEESGLIAPMTEWAFDQACRRLRDWSSQSGIPLLMAVNIPPKLLLRDDIEKQLANVVRKHGLSPSSVVLEITESGVSQGIELLNSKLKQLAMLGFSIAIDDFGTGYSSLGRLAYLPISKLKVDKEFVDRIEDEEESRRLLGSILSMAQALELEVVIEGVENEAQIHILRDYDARITVQGYYFEKPQPEDYWDGVFISGAIAPYKLPDRPPANKRSELSKI